MFRRILKKIKMLEKNYKLKFYHRFFTLTAFFCVESDSLQRKNRRLRETCLTGHISFHKCCQTLYTFKITYLREFDFQITENNLKNFWPVVIIKYSLQIVILYFIFSRIVNRLSNSWRSSFGLISFMLNFFYIIYII